MAPLTFPATCRFLKVDPAAVRKGAPVLFVPLSILRYSVWPLPSKIPLKGAFVGSGSVTVKSSSRIAFTSDFPSASVTNWPKRVQSALERST